MHKDFIYPEPDPKGPVLFF